MTDKKKKSEFKEPRLETFEELVLGEWSYRIPLYQRHVSWAKGNVERLFYDIMAGVSRLAKEIFLGVVIFHADIDEKSNIPRLQTSDIIDGQQRLTALMIICALLHDYIRVNVNKTKEWRENDWLMDECQKINQRLLNSIRIDTKRGEQRYHPRIIRASVDKLSKNKEDTTHKSPLASFVSRYSQYVEDASNNTSMAKESFEYKFDDILPSEEQSDERKYYKKFKQLTESVRLSILKFCNNSFSSSHPDVVNIIRQESTMSTLKLDNSASSKLNALRGKNTRYHKIFRALVLASYILERIRFVSLSTSNESSAFDVFESLNTTGVLLTAIETLKPAVVNFEGGADKYSTSDSIEHFKSIESYIETKDDEKQKANVSRDIVTHFALANDGTALSGYLSEQRLYLRDKYSDEKNECKRGFTYHLMCASQVMRYFYDGGGKLDSGDKVMAGDELHTIGEYKNIYSPSMKGEWDEAHFCLYYLREAKHTIAQAMITRFHHAVMQAKNDTVRKKCIDELFCAIKAIAAFFALWRGSRSDTDGIDSLYRTLFNEQPKIMNFSRKGNNIPSAKGLQHAFVRFLKEKGSYKINNVEEFVEYNAVTPVVKAKATAKFLILVASHNTIPEVNNGKPTIFLQPRVEGPSNVLMISADVWRAPECYTAEHIIPRSEAKRLPNVNISDLDVLGNLTLLPSMDNSIVGRRTWDQRRKIYAILSEENPDRRKKLIDAATFLSDRKKRYFSSHPHYLPLTLQVARCEEFNISVMKKRGENLAKLAWRILANEWLDFDTHS